MKRKQSDSISSKKADAKEFIALFENLPKEKKTEVLGIVRGYALCAESLKRA